MRAVLTGLALICATGVAAHERHDDRYERKRVAPGELISRTVSCPEGHATGGGYALVGQPEDRIDFAVLANFPLFNGDWRVELRNISDSTVPLVLRVYVLCDTD